MQQRLQQFSEFAVHCRRGHLTNQREDLVHGVLYAQQVHQLIDAFDVRRQSTELGQLPTETFMQRVA